MESGRRHGEICIASEVAQQRNLAVEPASLPFRMRVIERPISVDESEHRAAMVLAKQPVIVRQSMTEFGDLADKRLALLLVVIVVGAWSTLLMRKVHRQATAIAARTEAEAYLERRRSRILEDINGAKPLAEIIEQISDMVSCKLEGAPCWCQIADGARAGDCPAETQSLRIVHLEIPAHSGAPLGRLFAALGPLTQPSPKERGNVDHPHGIFDYSRCNRRSSETFPWEKCENHGSRFFQEAADGFRSRGEHSPNETFAL